MDDLDIEEDEEVDPTVFESGDTATSGKADGVSQHWPSLCSLLIASQTSL